MSHPLRRPAAGSLFMAALLAQSSPGQCMIAWQSGGSFPAPVRSMALRPNGELVIGGGPWSTVGSSVAVRVGGTWLGFGVSPTSSGAPINDDLAVMANGSVFIVGGYVSTYYPPPFFNPTVGYWPAARVSPTGVGYAGAFPQLQTRGVDVIELVDGRFVARTVLVFGGTATNFASLEYFDVAGNAIGGGSGGADQVTAVTLPWRGGTYRSRATGLPAIALTVGVYGFAPTSLPLALISPVAAPGCDLLVMPDVLQLGVSTTGVVEDAITLAHPSVFGGQVLYHQVVAIGLDAAGAIVEWSSSNALELTVGVF